MEEKTTLTRGKLLKRAGAGAALIAGGSVFTAESAFADVTPDAKTQTACYKAAVQNDDGACGICNGQVICGDGSCGCIIQTNGCCFCHQGSSCSQLPPCTTNRQCPKGWKCAASCCFDAGFGTLCHPPCGSAAAPRVAGQAYSMR